MAVGVQSMEQGQHKGGYQNSPADYLIAKGKPLAGLESGNAGSSNNQGEQNDADLPS